MKFNIFRKIFKFKLTYLIQSRIIFITPIISFICFALYFKAIDKVKFIPHDLKNK